VLQGDELGAPRGPKEGNGVEQKSLRRETQGFNAIIRARKENRAALAPSRGHRSSAASKPLNSLAAPSYWQVMDTPAASHVIA